MRCQALKYPITTSIQHQHGLDFKEVNEQTGRKKWVDGKELSDLDVADDIVLLHGSCAGMQA